MLGACSSIRPPRRLASTTAARHRPTSRRPAAHRLTTTSTAVLTTTAAGPARCATTALTGSVAGSSGAAGTIETTVALKSTATAPCVARRLSRAAAPARPGSALPTKVVRKGTYSFTSMAPTTVTLAPGQSAYFNIGYSDVPVGNETTCPTSASLEVTPPNAYDHLAVAATLAPCGGAPWWSPRCSWPPGPTARPRRRHRLTGQRLPAPARVRPPGRTSIRPLAPPARIRSRAGPELVEADLSLDHVLDQGRAGRRWPARPRRPAARRSGSGRCRCR